jgi:hypothetical protein
MASQPDFVVFSPDHQLLLVVEVKATPKVNEEWAAKLRRNLLTHGALPPAPYFLLVLPDHLYLWSQAGQLESVLPDFRADTKKVLQRYLTRWQQSEGKEALSERGLELAVGSWLRDLTTPDHWASSDTSESDWLKPSGLPDKIRTGVVESQPAL